MGFVRMLKRDLKELDDHIETAFQAAGEVEAELRNSERYRGSTPPMCRRLDDSLRTLRHALELMREEV